MKKYESVLKFIKYEVNEINYKLVVDVFENALENNKPFEMKVHLTGYFITEGENPEIFKANAIAILYPYVRAIVSTYTANANITPLILPAINVNKLIEDQKKN